LACTSTFTRAAKSSTFDDTVLNTIKCCAYCAAYFTKKDIQIPGADDIYSTECYELKDSRECCRLTVTGGAASANGVRLGCPVFTSNILVSLAIAAALLFANFTDESAQRNPFTMLCQFALSPTSPKPAMSKTASTGLNAI